MDFEKTIVCEMLFGSHLYGTSTPESDKDFFGVYMPSLNEVLSGQVQDVINLSTASSDSKNTSEDVDRTFYSFPKFIREVIKGNTTALDMLHAPDSALLYTSDVWKALRENRSKAYTKNMRTFVGYVRTQANKYGEKGRRVNVVKAALKLCESIRNKEDKLEDYWEFLPVNNEHAKIVIIEHEQLGTQYFYEICSRKFQSTITFHEFESRLKSLLDSYGERARTAADSKGVDWKAVMHAFRAGYQARAIFKEGDFTYPLPETEFLKEVRLGKLNFKDDVSPKLDALVREVEELSELSDYPAEVDKEFWVNLMLEVYKDVFGLKTENPAGYIQ